jgi:hypothetical protein
VRRQFEAYLNKVFGFSDLTAALPEGREHPQHPIKKVFDAIFLGAACQFRSLLEIEQECRKGTLSKRIGEISNNTFTYAFQRQDAEPVFQIGCTIAKRLKRNGVLSSTWSMGRTVVAVDGIEIFKSFHRCCDACMERKIEKKVKKEKVTLVQYYHRLSAAVMVSSEIAVPLGIRFQQQGETEVACSKALLLDLRKSLGPRFMDVLVGDALYLQEPFIREIEKMGFEWVVTLKDNQPELLAEAERLTTGPAQVTEDNNKHRLELHYAPEAYWPVAKRSVRIVKAVRTEKKKRVAVTREAGKRTKRKVASPTETTNYYASNIEVGARTAPVFMNQLGRSRWRIDTEVFQTLTTVCHIKRAWVHESNALVVVTMIRLLAYVLTVVYYGRQVCSHTRSLPITFSSFAHSLARQTRPAPVDSG